jgi:hypothetical protein
MVRTNIDTMTTQYIIRWLPGWPTSLACHAVGISDSETTVPTFVTLWRVLVDDGAKDVKVALTLGEKCVTEALIDAIGRCEVVWGVFGINVGVSVFS